MKATINDKQNIEGTPKELAEFFKEYHKANPNVQTSDLKASVKEEDSKPKSKKKKVKARQWANWTRAEEQYLKDNRHRKNSVLAKELKRTTNAVSQRKSRLGILNDFQIDL